MKRFAALIFLLLCALALLPCAMAEDSYVPGETARQLIAESWNAGKIIRGDMKLRLKADASALGLDEEEAAILEAILPVLDQVTIGLGAGKTESGIRVEADAYLAHAQGGEPVTVSAAANLDLYGVCVESDLIPGQRVTSRWETLMAMAGMNDDDINTFVLFRDLDWEAFTPKLIEMIKLNMQLVIVYAQPYTDIFTNWASSLPLVSDAGPLPKGCPSDTLLSSVIVTESDLIRLGAELSRFLKRDKEVSNLLNRYIQEGYTGEGTPPTVEQICDAIINKESQAANTKDYIKLSWGNDSMGLPVCGFIQLVSPESGTITISLSCAPNTENNNEYTFAFDIVNSDNTPYVSMSCAGEAGNGLFTAHAEMTEEGTQIMGMEYALTTTTIKNVLPVQKLEQKISMVVDDGETSVQMIGSTTATASKSIDGGETIDETTNMDMYVDGVQITTTALETLAIYPDTEGFTGTYSTMQTMPQMGINAIGMDVYLADKDYDPATTAALSETALETSSRETIDALLNAVMVNGQYKLIAAMQALPTEVLSILMSM